MASIPSGSADRTSRPTPTFHENADPRFVFRTLLARLPFASLRAMGQSRGHESEAVRASTLAGELTELLDDPLSLPELRRELTAKERLVLGLFGITESPHWPLAGLRHAAAALGVDDGAILGLIQRGLLAVEVAPPPVNAPASEVVEPASWLTSPPADARVWAHPSLAQGGRLKLPEDLPLEPTGPVAQVREADGLEPILRMAALWQRTGAGPLRRTQQGVLYKRDRERLEEDGLLAAPIDDVAVELARLPDLWMGLAQRVGLIHVNRDDDSLESAPAEFWTENAVHLPQMIASAWLGLRTWNEWGEANPEAPALGLPVAFLRPAVMLWLTTLEPDDWTTIDAVAARLDVVYPDWNRIDLDDDGPPARRVKAGGKKGPGLSREAQSTRLLERILLGGALALGLVRMGEEQPSRKKAVQLTPLGRYVMAVGPPPPPRPAFDQFLFVQPNLEVIAYRQGLTPPLIGTLSRFATWSRFGAAVELRLTQESIALGLEWGLTSAQILEILSRHSQRALPGSVKDAVDRWADRREQVTFYSSATLIEFSAAEERDLALASWNAEEGQRRPFVAVGARFILVEDPQSIPTSKISMTAARDYRLPPEQCVNVEADGVTLSLDPSRSDLLVEAELSRFADEQRQVEPSPRGTAARRRFTISARTLERGVEAGLTPPLLSDWFLRRTGEAAPPAVRLMMRPLTDARPWPAQRLLVLNVPSADLLDGILQHPETRPLLGNRLGPVSVVVPEDAVDGLREALRRFGLAFQIR